MGTSSGSELAPLEKKHSVNVKMMCAMGVKKKEADVRRRMVVVRLSEGEYERLQYFQKMTTEATVSNYLRRVALNKPVVVKYRNQTADDFLRDMLELKKELSTLGNNYNQAVKKLHLLDKIAEFRSWLLVYEHSRQAFLQKVDQIHMRITRLYELWLQK